MAKIPRVPVEKKITTPSVVKIAIKFSPCTVKKFARKIQLREKKQDARLKVNLFIFMVTYMMVEKKNF